MSKHFHAMAGLHGYMPNYLACHDTKTAAAEDLAQLHDLSKNAAKRLRKDMYVELDLAQHGNEYAEITECDCADRHCCANDEAIMNGEPESYDD